MSVVDDYGRYYAHETLLRAACYPFQLELVKDDYISKHLAECVNVRLIFRYTVNGIVYLQMLDFRQQTRAKSKFPEPSEQLLSKCISDANQLESDGKSNVLVVGVGVEGVVGVGVEGDKNKVAAGAAVRLNSKKRKSQIPDDFGVTFSPSMQAWLVKRGETQVKAHLIHFVGWAKSKGHIYADWEQTFQNAIRDDWAKIRTEGGGSDRWWLSNQGIQDKASELGITAKSGEGYGDLKQRIFNRIGR